MPQLAFIWDLDGTLVDSYPAIVPSAVEVCASLGLARSPEYVREYVIRTSVRSLMQEEAAGLGLDYEPLWARFNQLSDSRLALVEPMPQALETLQALCAAGCPSFIYTHRGASCGEILRRTGLAPFFTEVLTAQSGFPRKPEPDAILFLLEKYRLDPARCYYVGDRRLDMEAAERAGIPGVLYLPGGSPVEPNGREAMVIHELSELKSLI